MSALLSASPKKISSAYQGLIPSISASPKPAGGYHTVYPSCVSTITSERLSRTYSPRETTAMTACLRRIRCRSADISGQALRVRRSSRRGLASILFWVVRRMPPPLRTAVACELRQGLGRRTVRETAGRKEYSFILLVLAARRGVLIQIGSNESI